MATIAFLLPDGFSEFRNTDRLAPFWYIITMTGGVYGVSMILIFFIFFMIIKFRNKPFVRKNITVFIITVILVQVIISASALYYFKDLFHESRPSQLYFIEKGVIQNGGKEFFAMPMEEKSIYLKKQVEENKILLKDVYPPILDRWIYETGYSFPSGHAQTAFFLGTILAFSFYKIYPRKYYFVIPLIWAILLSLSRVLIGVHFPLDVTVGGLISLVIALYIVSLKKFNTIFE